MEQLRDAFESLRNWWFDLHYSQIQKRALLGISVVLIALSVLIVARGNNQESHLSQDARTNQNASQLDKVDG